MRKKLGKILFVVCVEMVVPRVSTLRVQEEKAPIVEIKTREPVPDRPVKILQNRKNLDPVSVFGDRLLEAKIGLCYLDSLYYP